MASSRRACYKEIPPHGEVFEAGCVGPMQQDDIGWGAVTGVFTVFARMFFWTVCSLPILWQDTRDCGYAEDKQSRTG